MGNYCIVRGCGRNYRKHKQLNYYTLPKDRIRLTEWLKAAGRKDLLEDNDNNRHFASYRVCSRHFPLSSFKNKHLLPNAVPSLQLPGTNDIEIETNDSELHEDIVCDRCTNPIAGYRYKCTTCPNYDLCGTCEGSQVHSHHIMMRLPRPMKNVQINRLITQWRNFLSSEDICLLDTQQDSDNEDSSDDDEPITKYASKTNDSCIDLSEDVKNRIRSEVSRVLNLRSGGKNNAKSRNRNVSENNSTDKEPASKKLKVETEFNIGGNQKYESVVDESDVPEVAFADVNDVGDQMMETKAVFLPDAAQSASTSAEAVVPETEALHVSQDSKPPMNPGGVVMPMMHVKLSDDLSELMIEVTSNYNQKTVYKYT